ncbi:hypothetical protein [Paenibacillus algicola]|uniref:hypothetical protein n=1 Tax=Paenibacillus algicola TaxID=2565926 RepID=UPI00158607DD|nr:hypothetical protein [Paenibacillus algicola]
MSELNYYDQHAFFTSIVDRGVREDELSWFIIETVISGGIGAWKKAVSSATKNAVSKGDTVWSFIRQTQAVREGTLIPRSFELTSRNAGKMWVHPNATKHMEEYVKRYTSHSYSINQQALLTSFKSAVDYATKKGIEYNKLVNVRGWELKFSKKEGDILPVIMHAVYR